MIKRFLFTIGLMAFFVFTLEPTGHLLSKFLRLEEPTTHEIREGDWLSKIAIEYYGEASYWRELALINRAPDGDLIFPGEKIIVPEFEAIQQVRQSRSLSQVNEVVDHQELILAGRVAERPQPVAKRPDPAPANQQVEPETASPETAVEEPAGSTDYEYGEATADDATFSTPMVTALVILLVIMAVGGFLYWRHRKRQEEIDFYGSTAEEDAQEKGAYSFGRESDAKGSKESTRRRETHEVA